MATNADRIRLAVALSVLKYKPLEQSFSAYVLDLRIKFPLSSLGISPDELWRNFALKIDRDCRVLQEKYDAERIKCLSLENSLAMPSNPPDVNDDPTATKKKAKKKQNILPPAEKCTHAPMAFANLKSILADPHIGALPRISPSHSLFSYLDEFVQLISLPETNRELLSAVTSRLIESIAKLTKDIVSLPAQNTLADARMLEHLAVALYNILATTFPSLMMASKSDDSMIKLINKATTHLLTPLVHAYPLRSRIHLQSILLPQLNGAKTTSSSSTGTNKKQKPPPAVDVREEMLTLFRSIFCLMNKQLQAYSTRAGLSLDHHTLQASLILETVREIDQLLVPTSSLCSSTGPACGVDSDINQEKSHMMQRVTRLATKETLWYLCAILNVLFDESSGRVYSGPQLGVVVAPASGTDDKSRKAGIERQDKVQNQQQLLLSKAISDVFFRLATRCKPPPLKRSTPPHQRYTRRRENEDDGSKSDIGGAHDQHAANLTHGETSYVGSDLRYLGVTRGVVVAEVSGVRLGEKSRGDDSRRPDVERFDVGAGSVGGGGGDGGGGGEIEPCAAGQSGRSDNGAASVPQGACELGKKEYHGEGTVELDQVGYGMLLGVIEQYWVWSGSWEH